MTGTKKWYLSKTLWGGIIILFVNVLAILGYSISEGEVETLRDSLLVTIEAVANLVGVILVIYGRLVATKVVK